jgi:hypothetical protein
MQLRCKVQRARRRTGYNWRLQNLIVSGGLLSKKASLVVATLRSDCRMHSMGRTSATALGAGGRPAWAVADWSG